jgi:hypothetical protein
VNSTVHKLSASFSNVYWVVRVSWARPHPWHCHCGWNDGCVESKRKGLARQLDIRGLDSLTGKLLKTRSDLLGSFLPFIWIHIISPLLNDPKLILSLLGGKNAFAHLRPNTPIMVYRGHPPKTEEMAFIIIFTLCNSAVHHDSCHMLFLGYGPTWPGNCFDGWVRFCMVQYQYWRCEYPERIKTLYLLNTSDSMRGLANISCTCGKVCLRFHLVNNPPHRHILQLHRPTCSEHNPRLYCIYCADHRR